MIGDGTEDVKRRIRESVNIITDSSFATLDDGTILDLDLFWELQNQIELEDKSFEGEDGG